MEHHKLGKSLVVYANEDPTFGSWRFRSTLDTTIFKTLVEKIKKEGYSEIATIIVSSKGDNRHIPPGWIYEDIANYYGAASFNLNWHENQYDVHFVPGANMNEAAKIVMTPDLKRWKFVDNEVKTGAPGSGDNAYIYFVPGESRILIQGTIPSGVSKFTIAGADVNPVSSFSSSFIDYAATHGLEVQQKSIGIRPFFAPADTLNRIFYSYSSPTLDSIVYWFLQKSINLYGEALIKTFASEKKGFDAIDTGITIVKDFWRQKGLDPDELNIRDGSGLSPQNRVTTHAEVEILKYAKQQSWFPYFFGALPEFNHMKMKSGSISDVKGFCGYHTSADGAQYIFSFLVNNYSDGSGSIVNKMYKVLDVLK